MPEDKEGGYQPTPEEARKVEEMMYPHEKQESNYQEWYLKGGREWLSKVEERKAAATKILKKIFGENWDLLRKLGVDVQGMREGSDSIKPEIVCEIAKAAKKDVFITVSEIQRGGGRVLFRLWNEEPKFGADRHGHPFHPDMSANGSILINTGCSAQEAIEALKDIEAEPVGVQPIGGEREYCGGNRVRGDYEDVLRGEVPAAVFFIRGEQ